LNKNVVIPPDWTSHLCEACNFIKKYDIDFFFKLEAITIFNIPRACLHMVVKAFTSILLFISQNHKEDSAWSLIPLFCKAVFAAVNKNSKGNLKNVITRRLDLWYSKKFPELLAHVARFSGTKGRNSNKYSRCEKLVSDNRISDGCAALLSEGIAEPNDTTLNLLYHKHPKGRSLPTMIAPETNPIRINIQELVTQVNKIKRTSAAGPSGLRPSHLRDICNAASNSDVCSALCKVINFLLMGKCCDNSRKWIFGAKLTALKKKGGSDVRPIACGDVIRRVIGKFICFKLSEQFKDYLSPFQY